MYESSWSLFERIQLAMSPTHTETSVENTSTLQARMSRISECRQHTGVATVRVAQSAKLDWRYTK
jgi:hypothetical protein